MRGTARKLIAFEPDILRALELLARDRMQDFQELADEAFRDVLKKLVPLLALSANSTPRTLVRRINTALIDLALRELVKLPPPPRD